MADLALTREIGWSSRVPSTRNARNENARNKNASKIHEKE
jgi:hypothetical protein